ncbi:hypothetical protein QTO30_14965 [Yoonia sp. GPGPB17]|uniref:hypothetical protein n=1 Tax=Yoonia sp. GPGPB17 TaxID=3026147 RepID=UPI0030C32252
MADAIDETPVIQPEVVEAPTGSSDWIIPVLIFGALAAVAISSSDDDGDTPTTPTPPTPPTPGPVTP